VPDDPSPSEVAPDPDYYALDADASVEAFLAVAKVYARDVVARHDLSVTVSDLEWGVSTRAKRRAGAVRYRDGTPVAVSLTLEQFRERGWSAAAETIRHELLHVHLLNERGDPSHGERFRRLADRLDTRVRCDRFAEPNWWIRCADCGAELARYRRSKLVESTHEYRCGDCGGALHLVDDREDG
jgi:predicted SprT family Zn-dependent metalloprotease